MFKKIFKPLLITLMCCAVLYAAARLIIPIILLVNQDDIYRAQLNNRYIDSDYSGWTSVEFDENHSVLLPDSWEVSFDSPFFQISDADGAAIALACVHSKEDSEYDRAEDMIAAISDFPIIKTEREYLPAFRTARCDIHKLYAYGDAQTSEYHMIRLSTDTDFSMTILFLPDCPMTTDELIELSDAVIFAFCFM